MRRVLLTAALVAALIGLWALVAAHTEDLLLASPWQTADALWSDRSLLLDEAWVTLQEVLLGAGIAVVLGALAAVGMHLFRPLRDAGYPLLIGSQAVPVVVLAPLFVLAFDYGMTSKLAIVAVVCFFPVTVNLLDGLRSADPQLLKLMRSMGASRLGLLRRAELPSALPYFFSGVRVAATVAVIAAVFGEWAGADEGLGRLVLRSNDQLDTSRVYAGVVLLAVMAVLLFLITTLAERIAVPWREETT
jgi:NitT/TauT family transport system permease protein/putative hydroxymethylpyrimidine transport system permease protein